MAQDDKAQNAMNADFDPAALEAFLGGRFGEGQMTLERIGGGQSNPTYFVDFGARRMVLRKKPAGPILRGAHAIDREFRVLEALAPTSAPVPKPVLYHDGDAPLGTPFYLMERLEGRVFHDCSLPGLSPDERRGIYLGMAEAMAKLHAVRPDGVGLGDYGKPGNYFERQIGRWTRQLRNRQANVSLSWRRWPTGCRRTCRRTMGACRSRMAISGSATCCFIPKSPR